MKISIFLKLFIYICVILFLANCFGNKTIDTPKEDNMVIHNILLEGKEVSFSLPKEYTDKNIEAKFRLKQYYDNDNLRDAKKLFFSNKDDNRFFAIFTSKNDIKFSKSNTNDRVIDSLVRYEMANFEELSSLGSIAFAERGQNKNNYPYVIFTMLSRYYNYEDYYKKRTLNDCRECVFYELLRASDSLESTMVYDIFIENIRFRFAFETIEKMDEYSYEEKRKVIESISIN